MRVDLASLPGRFARYLLSGGIVVAVDYAVFFFLDRGIGAGLALSQGCARLAGAVLGFFLQRNFVFAAGRQSPGGVARQGFAYGALTVFNIALSAWCADFLGNSLGLHPDIAVKLTTDALLAGETFFLLHLVFRRRVPG